MGQAMNRDVAQRGGRTFASFPPTLSPFAPSVIALPLGVNFMALPIRRVQRGVFGAETEALERSAPKTSRWARLRSERAPR